MKDLEKFQRGGVVRAVKKGWSQLQKEAKRFGTTKYPKTYPGGMKGKPSQIVKAAEEQKKLGDALKKFADGIKKSRTKAAKPPKQSKAFKDGSGSMRMGGQVTALRNEWIKYD